MDRSDVEPGLRSVGHPTAPLQTDSAAQLPPRTAAAESSWKRWAVGAPYFFRMPIKVLSLEPSLSGTSGASASLVLAGEGAGDVVAGDAIVAWRSRLRVRMWDGGGRSIRMREASFLDCRLLCERQAV